MRFPSGVIMSPLREVTADERDKTVRFGGLLTEDMELYRLPLDWMKRKEKLRFTVFIADRVKLLIGFLDLKATKFNVFHVILKCITWEQVMTYEMKEPQSVLYYWWKF